MIITKILNSFCTKIKPNRTFITPQPFTVSPLQQYFHVTSKNYDFLSKSNPNCSEIYVHHSDTPSNLLRKNAIHIFPESITNQTLQEKYKAHIRRLEEDYKKSFEKCKNPAEVFHLYRRVKTDIRQRTKFIGRILGKYKHYNLFKSVNQINRQKTQEQYKKNGISVPLLGKNKIYPQGPVWLPTTDTYLKLLEQYLGQNYKESPSSILDLGCGSGILSFILAKQFKSSKIYAVDSNKYAVETCSVNAASFGLNNITSLAGDATQIDDLLIKLREQKAPANYDLIITNPPWLIANRNAHESQILDGVYDEKGKFLQATFKIASKLLKDKKSKFLLIYSDLSHHLGLQLKTIDQLCKQNNLLVVSKLESDYPKAIEKQSPLAPYKLKSHVQFYQICKSS